MAYTVLSAASSGQLINAAWMNVYVRDNINALNGNGVVPPSAILWWPFDVALRPDNWFACDGTFGVSDLRDRMIVGAGSTYAVNDRAGALTAALAAHTAHSLSAPSHGAHTILASASHTSLLSPAVNWGSASVAYVNNVAHAGGSSDTSAHTSQALTDTHAHSGSPYSVLPPYVALTPMLKGTPTVAVGTPRTWADGDVPTAAMFNADIRDAIAGLRQRMLWANSVIVWSGSLAALPSGYQLCDGTNGTVDLQGRFNIAAGTTYVATITGGAATLAIPAHSNHSPTQADSHAAHATVSVAAHGTGLGSQGPFGIGNIWGADATTAHSVTISGSHGSHSGFAVDAHSAHADVATLPPYIALGYIQLVSASTYTTPRTWTDGELVDAARMNTYVRDNEGALYAGQVPIGGILAWHNSIASIPANYAHCNGSGGIPETRDKFIMGAGGSVAVSSTGGALTVTPAAHIAHIVTQAGTHGAHGASGPSSHPFSGATVGGGGSGYQDFSSSPPSVSHAFSVNNTGLTEHAHAFAIDAGAAHAAHSAMSLLPPYHALAFIQRAS